MKVDDGNEEKASFFGGICSLSLLIVVIAFTYQKVDVLINKRDVDILSTVNENFFTADEVFNQ